MQSQVFQFVFRDVGMGTGECQVEIQFLDTNRLTVILTESGKTRLGSIRSAFDLVATQLYAKRLAQTADPQQVTWIYRKTPASDEKIELAWDGERFSALSSVSWLGRQTIDALFAGTAAGLSPLPSN